MFHLDVQSDISQKQNNYQQCSNYSLQRIPSISCSSSINQKNIIKPTSNKKIDLFHLRKVITKHKVKILTKNFISKISQNNTLRKPPEQDYLQNSTQLTCIGRITKKLQQTNGIHIGNTTLTIWNLINLIQITIMVYIFSILIAFSNSFNQNKIILYFRVSSIVLYFIDILLNFVTQRFQNGKRLKNLKQIGTYYIQNGFCVDLASVLIFPLDLVFNSMITIVISFVALVKLLNTVKKLQKLEYLYIKNAERQQYYGLFKIIMTNFVIGHFLSIFLNMMALINSERNWQFIVGIQTSDWLTKYIWGYYWGTNIMLTVGFGDISATNTTQAALLIFIQTISCITLAYNISTVGALMTELRSSNQKKKKQLQVFHRMSQQNQISGELNTRISNFIEESFQIRETFQFQKEDQLIQSLPKGFQSQFRIQSNKILFDKIGFLNNLSAKTLILLAQKIQRKISHPDQIIKKKGTPQNFMIVSNGSLGLCFRRGQAKLNGTIIQQISHKIGQKPKLVSLGFIKNKFFQFDIKSIGYSIIYFMQRPQFVQFLKQSEMDYQFFCTMRDKDNYVTGQDEINVCTLCKNQYHTKFKCSRLHYIPIKQNIIYKKKFNQPKCSRFQFERQKQLQSNRILLQIKRIKNQYQKFLQQHFGHSYIQKLLISKIYFQKLIKAKTQINFSKRRRAGLFQKTSQSKQLNEQIPNQSLSISQFAMNTQLNSNYEKLQKLLLRQNNQYRGFWDVQSDEIYNFRYYFPKSNAENIGCSDLTESTIFGTSKFFI